MEFMLWIWVAIAVITAIVELATVQMVSIWFTAGALSSLIAYGAKAPYWAQIIVFFVVSFIFLICFRKMSMKWLLRNLKDKTNSDALIGTIVKLTQSIDSDGHGETRINDVTWTVVSKSNFRAEIGEHVKIVAIDGNKLIVDKTK